jgi:cell division protein ZapA
VREASTPIAIRILDKEYNVGCPPAEREALLQAAELLDRKMREMRDGGRVIGAERVAVITALNLAHELLQDRRRHETLAESVGAGMQRIQGKLELALRGDSSGQTV